MQNNNRQRPSIGIVAAPFGFGPCAKSIAIAQRFSSEVESHFFSSARCADFVETSGVFSKVISIDFENPTSLEAHLSTLDAVISVNTTRFNKVVVRQGTPHFFVDTLAWARSAPPDLINQVKMYFVQNFFDHSGNLNNWRTERIMDVGVIRQAAESFQAKKTDTLLVHIGGLSSPVIPDQICEQFIDHVGDFLSQLQTRSTLLLPTQFRGVIGRMAGNVDVVHCSPNEIPEYLSRSFLSLTTPGIEHVYESIISGVTTLLLPPFNTSQVLQTRYFFHKFPEMVPYSGIEKFDNVDCGDLVSASKHIHEILMDGVWQDMFSELKSRFTLPLGTQKVCEMRQLGHRQQDLLSSLRLDGAETIASEVEKCLT